MIFKFTQQLPLQSTWHIESLVLPYIAAVGSNFFIPIVKKKEKTQSAFKKRD